VLVMTVGGLAGTQIASSAEWATLPIATMFLGTAITTFPASAWMAKFGRRSGFVLGAMLGTLGGLIGAAGIWLGMLSLLSLGTLLVGPFQAFAQFYRFAASKVADDAFRPRAISLVLTEMPLNCSRVKGNIAPPHDPQRRMLALLPAAR
jgi:hypothetical protein